ncbi:hypothetical protein EBI01_08870 [Marinomonas rhizomae]|uniref:Uncharacterized protein n=1 Tax=Marinomonas rhizomae TaxID=491948 RepID=A0A366J691_9GAMM|nr:hypothetical protein [Marinomonas rhizomae]RBP82387.1 hypothetical protein DFP80_10833 [Marinomonas rhizomae]RNF73814.1 hypothetical protein EBI01_08870 [Marinomonas rhizomae]
MKNNLIPFPSSRQRHDEQEASPAFIDELKALRTAFDKARADWVVELAELPENNKICCGSKK